MKSVAALICAGIMVVGCGRPQERGLIDLAQVEVREYEGEQLGSMLDFRETSIKGPQQIDIKDYHLEVSGLVEEPRSFTYEEVLAFPSHSKVVTIHCVEGWSVKILWEGVLIRDIVQHTGLKPEANTVIFHAYDGYTTSLPLAYVVENDILLAYRMNQVVLPPERGFPFQVVAESKLGYKWAKWVTGIEVSADLNYKGFWESRGFDNQADI
jgi:DMSO/TMAO reductase YedYZ molybdopterin-dependent catalytic subunit